jgi:hypothetical protein
MYPSDRGVEAAKVLLNCLIITSSRRSCFQIITDGAAKSAALSFGRSNISPGVANHRENGCFQAHRTDLEAMLAAVRGEMNKLRRHRELKGNMR